MNGVDGVDDVDGVVRGSMGVDGIDILRFQPHSKLRSIHIAGVEGEAGATTPMSQADMSTPVVKHTTFIQSRTITISGV